VRVASTGDVRAHLIFYFCFRRARARPPTRTIVTPISMRALAGRRGGECGTTPVVITRRLLWRVLA